MINNLTNRDFSTIDYNVVDITNYYQGDKCKVLILDDNSFDDLSLRELYISNPKVIVILITTSPNSKHYELGIDVLVNEDDYVEKINFAIRNLDIRHKLISRVVIKEDFNKINIGGIDIRLTPKEMAIYSYLNKNRGLLCKRSEMLTQVLGYHEGADSRVVDVYVKHLRTKLREEGYKIETIRGKGYIYNF